MDPEPKTRRAGRGEPVLDVPPPARPYRAVAHRVLHVVDAPATEPAGAALPRVEAWLRDVVALERDHGLEPTVVTEMGVRSEATYAVEVLDGIAHHRIPGAARGGGAGQRWLATQATRLATVVRKVRPGVLVVAARDPVPRAAAAVGRAYGIPVVRDPGPEPGLDHLAAYEQVGVLPAGARVMAALSARPEDLARLREHVHAAALRPLEAGMRANPRLADEILDQGWEWGFLPRVSLEHPVDWRSLCVADRSHDFRLHAWDMMLPALARYAQQQQDRYLRWCVALAVSWCRAFTDGDAAGTMAWYDMALALRAPKLAFLLQEALRCGYDDEVTAVLHAGVVRHQRELHRPAAFAAHNNHGFYTAVGQLALARRLPVLPGMDELAEQGVARLAAVALGQFAEDGGHREHSPDYHRMLLDSFVAAIDEGLVDDPEVTRRVVAAQQVMGWFVRPDRTMLQVGDSPEQLLSRASPAAAEASTAFLVTGGAVGSPATETLKVLPSSGYAIVRSPQPVGRRDHRGACYLSLMAGFHSRVHKHADDLSLTWFDRGHELLVDAGRFGYLDTLPADSPDRLAGFYYSRPERQYVESTRAHNTVEADGRDHERRNRTPYGSAILDGRQDGSRYRLLAEVDHGFWRHRREVVVEPQRWLRVRDEVTSTDGRPHDFRVWWNLPQELAWRATGPGSVVFATADGLPLTVTSLDGADLVEPVAGQQVPLRGWRSRLDRELTPAWSMAFVVLGCEHRVFDTLLRLGDQGDAGGGDGDQVPDR